MFVSQAGCQSGVPVLQVRVSLLWCCLLFLMYSLLSDLVTGLSIACKELLNLGGLSWSLNLLCRCSHDQGFGTVPQRSVTFQIQIDTCPLLIIREKFVHSIACSVWCGSDIKNHSVHLHYYIWAMYAPDQRLTIWSILTAATAVVIQFASNYAVCAKNVETEVYSYVVNWWGV